MVKSNRLVPLLASISLAATWVVAPPICLVVEAVSRVPKYQCNLLAAMVVS
ncbi:MAG: hypothetical protein JXA30_23110 [Deltaproteobacteria bacterium]|nr:hypothetical protein [Deltaproteobacteria bacterium]